MITFHHADTRGSRLHIFVFKIVFIHVSCLVPCRHLTLTTSTSSLSPTSPIFPTLSHSHPSPLAHDPYLLCEDPRLSGGSTQIPSLTGYEPKVIEPEHFEPRRIELDRKSSEKTTKILSPKTWMNLEKLVQRCPTSSHRCIPVRTHRKALQTRILKMENYEKCWPHRCMYMDEEEIMVLLKTPQLQGNWKQKKYRREIYTEKRSKCTTYSS